MTIGLSDYNFPHVHQLYGPHQYATFKTSECALPHPWTVVGLYRMLRAYVYRVEPPAWYFMDFRLWDTLANNAMLCIMTWLGDFLVVSLPRRMKYAC